MRALQWEFPHDPNLVGADRQFLLGPALLITPVLNEGATTVDGIFPGEAPWCDWYTQTVVPDSWHNTNTTINAPLGHIPIHVRGGHVIPLQEPANTTAESRKNSWQVLVALDEAGLATGSLYLDDGESQSPNQTQTVAFTARESQLTAEVNGKYKMGDITTRLATATIMGVQCFNGTVTFNGKKLDSVDYDANRKLLQVQGLQSMTPHGAWEEGWVISWTGKC